MPADNKIELLNLIATHSFKLGDFTLASGQKSDYYIDCRTTTLHAEGGRLSGLVLYDLIRERFPQAEAVGGLTMGADPLVSNIASASAWRHHQHHHRAPHDSELVNGFLVRKAEKTHGTGRRLEGFHKIGAHVVIVDDVCTTGGSTITAIEATKESGMNVIGVLCLVDREQGGRANIEAATPHAPFYSVFTANDVRKAHITGGGMKNAVSIGILFFSSVLTYAQDITVHVIEDKTNKPISGVTLNLRTDCVNPKRPKSLQQQTDVSGVTAFHSVSLTRPPVCVDLFSVTYFSLNLDYIFETPEQLKESGYSPQSRVGNPVITTFPADVTFHVAKRSFSDHLRFLFVGD